MGKIITSKISKNSGFTLIEVVVVAGIIALFSVTLVSVFLATMRGGNKSQLIQIVHQEGDFALKTMANVIRGADQVTCGGGSIDIVTLTGSVINFSTLDDNGIIRVASDSSTFLTGNRATVTNLDFACASGVLNNQVVTINLELSVEPTGGQIQEKTVQTFATSVSTRQY
jgi:prepilin-type N-terminal cleavage/methylation domain-containing protein